MRYSIFSNFLLRVSSTLCRRPSTPVRSGSPNHQRQPRLQLPRPSASPADLLLCQMPRFSHLRCALASLLMPTTVAIAAMPQQTSTFHSVQALPAAVLLLYFLHFKIRLLSLPWLDGRFHASKFLIVVSFLCPISGSFYHHLLSVQNIST